MSPACPHSVPSRWRLCRQGDDGRCDSSSAAAHKQVGNRAQLGQRVGTARCRTLIPCPVTRTTSPTATSSKRLAPSKTKIPSEVAGSASTRGSSSWRKNPLSWALDPGSRRLPDLRSSRVPVNGLVVPVPWIVWIGVAGPPQAVRPQ